MNNLKRVLIIALCSILCVCTIPRFSLRSEAASTATYALYEALLNLSGYLTTRGYSIVHEHGSSIPSISDLKEMSDDIKAQILFDIANKLNSFGANHDLPDAGTRFVNALSAAALTGAIVLDEDLRTVVDWWLNSSVASGSVEIGSIYTSISDYSLAPEFVASVYRDSSVYRSVSYSCSSIPIFWFAYSNLDSGHGLILPESINDFVFDPLTGYYVPPITSDVSNSAIAVRYEIIDYNGRRYKVPAYYIDFVPLNTHVNFRFYLAETKSAWADVFANYYNGTYDNVQTGSYVVEQITDTSSTDVLTSTNEIESDASVSGPTTIYLPSQSTFENLIDQYNQNALSYEDFIKSLGISSVSSDSTVSEKEDALATVVYPTEDYLWFTSTQWGADTLEETRKASASTRTEEDSLADSIANTLNGGSDPEDNDGKSRGKGLLALLLLGLGVWNTPIIAGDGTPSSGGADDGSTEGSGDTSGYLQQSIAGLAVAGGIVEDLFSAAGGSDGYGLAYTVGASFVIFSVIIGAANYFGALFSGSDTKQNIKNSGKQSRSKSPSLKSKKGG